MKQLMIILFLLISQNEVFCQETDANAFKGFPPAFIGDSIVKFKNSIVCAENYKFPTPFSDSSKCRSYRLTPENGDSVIVGPLKFPGVMLSIDAEKEINALVYTKRYDGTNNKAKAKDQDRDFADLAHFFDTYLQVKGQKKQYPKNIHQTGLFWRSGLYGVTVEKIISANKELFILHVTVAMADAY